MRIKRLSNADKLQTPRERKRERERLQDVRGKGRRGAEEAEEVQKRQKKSERKKRCRRGRRCRVGTDHASEDDECRWESSSIHVAPAPMVTHPQG